METTLDKIKRMVKCANTSSELLTDSMVEAIMPKIIEAIDNSAKEIGYDGFTYNRPATEYPKMIYPLLWHTVRPVVLNYLNEHHPQAWFKPMFMSTEEQIKMGLPV